MIPPNRLAPDGLRSLAASARRFPIKLSAIGVGIALAIALMQVLPEYFRLLPRSTRRTAIDGFLRTLMWGHAAAWLLASAGFIAFVLLSIREPDRRRRFARLGLLCGSTVLALGLGEMGGLIVSHARHRRAEPILSGNLKKGSADTLRLTVIGGSSARGYPYQPHLSIGQILDWKLGEAMPDRKVEVDILANGGADLEWMHRELAKLTVRPDILVIYSGHNEFQSRFAWSRTVHPRRWYAKLADYSPVHRLIVRGIDGNLLDDPSAPGPVRSPIDWPMVTPDELAKVNADFEHRLDLIGSFCRSNGVLPVWVVPPANDGGWAPSRSVLPESATEAERNEATRLLLLAKQADDTSEELDRELIRRWPSLAEPHFRLARKLERVGMFAEAREHDILSRELDGLRIRSSEEFRRTYREMADRHGGILIDGPGIFEAADPRGILDYDLFHDAHHPSLQGHTLLAEAIFRSLHDLGAFGLPKAASPPRIDPTDVATHFQMDADKWKGVCRQAIDTHRWAAKNIYDSVERLNWVRRFGSAAGKIARGDRPETTGVPGLGTSTAPMAASGRDRPNEAMPPSATIRTTPL